MIVEIEYKGKTKRYKRVSSSRAARVRRVYENLLGGAVNVRIAAATAIRRLRDFANNGFRL